MFYETYGKEIAFHSFCTVKLAVEGQMWCDLDVRSYIFKNKA